MVTIQGSHGHTTGSHGHKTTPLNFSSGVVQKSKQGKPLDGTGGIAPSTQNKEHCKSLTACFHLRHVGVTAWWTCWCRGLARAAVRRVCEQVVGGYNSSRDHKDREVEDGKRIAVHVLHRIDHLYTGPTVKEEPGPLLRDHERVATVARR